MENIKTIFDDKAKFSSIIAYAAMALLAFLLIFKIDVGASVKLIRNLKDTHDSLTALENITEYKSYISQFESQFAESVSAGQFMDMLADIANREGISLGSLKPTGGRSILGLKEVSIATEGTTDYFTLLRLLNRIEYSNKYLYVTSIGINSSGGGIIFTLVVAAIGA